MEIFKVRGSGDDLILVAGEACGELSQFYILRLSPRCSLAAKRDGLVYAYRLLDPAESREVRALLERLRNSGLSAGDVRALVASLLSAGCAEWGRRDMPVYRFASTVVEVSPPRRPRRLLVKTSSLTVAEALREMGARWMPLHRAWLVEAVDWRGTVERIRELAEQGQPAEA
ncbi:MAG: hypothetical protein QXG48_06210 [Thermofilaceae archaeon]